MGPMARISVSIALLVVVAKSLSATSPNVLFILTDDQDVMLGSFDPEGPLQETRKRIVEQGTWFENSFCHVPICCPSRASLITGRYMHNNGAKDNTCGGKTFQDEAEQHNLFTFAKAAGYTTYYAGKYLNNYGSLSGVERVPPGFDSWYGLKGNSRYYDYTVSNNGVAEVHGSDYHKDYYTDRLANRSLEFLHNVSQGVSGFSEPWVMMIGTPASHGPNTPAPQYQTAYANRKAPRTPSWNLAPQPEKHPLMQGIVAMDQGHIDTSDVFFERRWSVLKSVDDLVVKLLDELERMQAIDNTFIIFSADNGFHLGQFGMLYDKRMLYEHDIRIPLVVRGPGVRRNATSAAPVMHHDIAPTMLHMMGIARTPDIMDGTSWLSQVIESEKPKPWRGDFLVEYNGPKVATNVVMRNVTSDDKLAGIHGESEEISMIPGAVCTANKTAETTDCKCSCRYKDTDGTVYDRSPCDSKENTYKCLRTINATEDSNYCEFDDGYVEYYNTKEDPWGLVNMGVRGRTPQWKLDSLSRRLYAHMLCKGASCFDPPPAPANAGMIQNLVV